MHLHLVNNVAVSIVVVNSATTKKKRKKIDSKRRRRKAVFQLISWGAVLVASNQTF